MAAMTGRIALISRSFLVPKILAKTASTISGFVSILTRAANKNAALPGEQRGATVRVTGNLPAEAAVAAVVTAGRIQYTARHSTGRDSRNRKPIRITIGVVAVAGAGYRRLRP